MSSGPRSPDPTTPYHREIGVSFVKGEEPVREKNRDDTTKKIEKKNNKISTSRKSSSDRESIDAVQIFKQKRLEENIKRANDIYKRMISEAEENRFGPQLELYIFERDTAIEKIDNFYEEYVEGVDEETLKTSTDRSIGIIAWFMEYEPIRRTLFNEYTNPESTSSRRIRAKYSNFIAEERSRLESKEALKKWKSTMFNSPFSRDTEESKPDKTIRKEVIRRFLASVYLFISQKNGSHVFLNMATFSTNSQSGLLIAMALRVFCERRFSIEYGQEKAFYLEEIRRYDEEKRKTSPQESQESQLQKYRKMHKKDFHSLHKIPEESPEGGKVLGTEKSLMKTALDLFSRDSRSEREDEKMALKEYERLAPNSRNRYSGPKDYAKKNYGRDKISKQNKIYKARNYEISTNSTPSESTPVKDSQIVFNNATVLMGQDRDADSLADQTRSTPLQKRIVPKKLSELGPYKGFKWGVRGSLRGASYLVKSLPYLYHYYKKYSDAAKGEGLSDQVTDAILHNSYVQLANSLGDKVWELGDKVFQDEMTTEDIRRIELDAAERIRNLDIDLDTGEQERKRAMEKELLQSIIDHFNQKRTETRSQQTTLQTNGAADEKHHERHQ